MDLSIVIASWNTKALLLECLQSLIRATQCKRMEIIVVDNASADGSPEAVQAHFPEVRLIRNPANLGFAKANNIGIARSRGKYVCLVNSDIAVLPGCLDRMLEYMEAHPAVGMLGPRVLNPDLTLQSTCRRFPNLWNNFVEAIAVDKLFPRSRVWGGQFIAAVPRDHACRVDVLAGCFWMIRREALSGVGLLDEQFYIYGEDLDWCKRFWETGWEIVYFPFAEAIHYGSACFSQAPVALYIQMLRAKMQYWQKHHSRASQAGIWLIMILFQCFRSIANLALYLVKPAHLSKLKINVAAMGWLLNISSPKPGSLRRY